MKAKAGKKKVVLELGGNAACVVEDYRCMLTHLQHTCQRGLSQHDERSPYCRLLMHHDRAE